MAALGGMTIASAQSPFANSQGSQAWETPSAPQSAPPLREAKPRPAPAAGNGAPSQNSQVIPTPSSTYPPQSAPNSQNTQTYSNAPANPPVRSQSTQSYPPSSAASPYQYSGSASTSPFAPSKPSEYGAGQYSQGRQTAPTNYVPVEQLPSRGYPAQQGTPYGQSYTQAAPQNYPPQNYPAQSAPPQSYPPQAGPMAPRSWKDKMGLGNLTTILRGFIKGGVAAVTRDDDVTSESDWKEEFVGDAKAELEVSAITDTGYEYGVNLEGRAQYDKFRRGFGGRITDCPPTVAGCSSALIDGIPTALRGHTSRFYTNGPDEAEEGQIALESAHLFLRSTYGDITIGRDDGAAYLFSLGAPSLLAVGASNSPVDYTGLDSVKTINDASGFSEKVTYTSPRLLGDRIGVGVQFGGSYALNARACGVDYCVKRDDGTGTLAPDLEDILEVGLALDRTFDNGLKVEGTATYARGSEKSGFAGLDDLESFNLGAETSWMDITLGGSFLKSNNGLVDGDYKAWDIGATWKPSALGVTLGYGHAKDENVNLTSDQFVAGLTYDFEKFTLGAGAQYIERETQAVSGSVVTPQKDKATALFIEGGFEF
ncbi:Porin-like protein [Litorimonas haliclonae]